MITIQKHSQIIKVRNAELDQTQKDENMTSEQEKMIRMQIGDLEVQNECDEISYRESGDIVQKINVLCKKLGESYSPGNTARYCVKETI